MPGIVDFIAGLAQGGQNPLTGQPSTFGERLLNGVRSMDEGYQNYAQDAVKAKALRQVVAAYAQDEPDPDKAKNLVNFSHTAGLGDLEGFVQSHAAIAAARQAAAETAKTQAEATEATQRGGYFNSFAQERAQQAQDEGTVGKFLTSYFNAPPSNPDDEETDQTPMTPEERMAYATKNTPGLSSRHLPQIIDALDKWQQVQGKAGGTTQFDEDPVTGYRFASRGNTFMPSGVDQTKAPGEPVYSPDGKLFWNGKTWAPLKDLGYPEGATITSINGVNAVVDKNGRILKTVGALTTGQALDDVMKGGSGGQPAPASRPQPNAGGGAAKANELTRYTKDGRPIIYDAKTKKFLRYGD
jgi:hypothetical protein